MKINKLTLIEVLFLVFLGTQVFCGIKNGHWLGLIVFLLIIGIVFTYQWFCNKIL